MIRSERMFSKKAYLVLENGMIFEGKSFGYDREISGEVVFNTAMVGYLEALTDPRYQGQLLVQTFPLIGNYGVISEDLESDSCYPAAYIVREWCEHPSNFRSEGDINNFLYEKKIPGLYGIDTRKLTKVLREEGTMKGKLCYELTQTIKFLKPSKRTAYEVVKDQIMIYQQENAEFNVAVLNLGAKKTFFNNFPLLNIEAAVFGPASKASQLAELKPDGIVITHGPGNPDNYIDIVEEIEEILDMGIPVFGIGLGHQLIAMACGAKTAKLPYGHRGGSQPVRDIKADKVLITSQNHGYYVISQTLPRSAREIFVNVNDNTCEGLEYKDKPCFSLQFDPTPATEGNPGPYFGRFIQMMKEAKNNAAE